MMFKIIVLIILSMVCPADAEEDHPHSDEAWLREGLAAQVHKCKRITITPHPSEEGVAVANCETSLMWWSFLRVFHHTGDKLDWVAVLPEGYLENSAHYILSAEWRYLDHLNTWILEVFDSTHRGNGNLWLFVLEDRQLRTLLKTTALGHFLKRPTDLEVPKSGESCLVEPHLEVEYRAPNRKAAEEVILTGNIAAFDQEGTKLSVKPFRERWRWNPKLRVFTIVK